MKANVVRGSGFGGALTYVLDEEKQAEHIGGSMLGCTPAELSQEFSQVRALRPDVKKPVWHASLSLPKGEYLDSKKWEGVAADFMDKMGFDDLTPYTVARHKDTNYDHIHIIASRISASGDLWLGQWEAKTAINATQALEKEHKLTLTAGLGDERKAKKALKKNEIERAIRTKERPIRLELQDLIDDALEEPCTALEFVDRLAIAGVAARPNIASTGRMNGFSFEMNGIAFKGSSLGAGYKWKNLQEKGVSYEQARDCEGLTQLKKSAAESNLGATGGQQGAGGLTSGDSERGCSLGRTGGGSREDSSSPTQSDQLDSGADHKADERRDQLVSKEDQRSNSTHRTTAGDNGGVEQRGESSPTSIKGSRSKDKQAETQFDGQSAGTGSSGNDRGDNSTLWAGRFRKVPATVRNTVRQQYAQKSIEQSDTRGKGIDERNIETVSPGRKVLLEKLELLDETCHECSYHNICLEAELKGITPPKEVKFKSNDYSGWSDEKLAERVVERERDVAGHKENTWALESKKEQKQDRGYGPSL